MPNRTQPCTIGLVLQSAEASEALGPLRPSLTALQTGHRVSARGERPYCDALSPLACRRPLDCPALQAGVYSGARWKCVPLLPFALLPLARLPSVLLPPDLVSTGPLAVRKCFFFCCITPWMCTAFRAV